MNFQMRGFPQGLICIDFTEAFDFLMEKTSVTRLFKRFGDFCFLKLGSTFLKAKIASNREKLAGSVRIRAEAEDDLRSQKSLLMREYEAAKECEAAFEREQEKHAFQLKNYEQQIATVQRLSFFDDCSLGKYFLLCVDNSIID